LKMPVTIYWRTRQIVKTVEKFIKEKVPPFIEQKEKAEQKEKPEPEFRDLASHLLSIIDEKPDSLLVAACKGFDADGKGQYDKRTFSEVDKESNRVAHGLFKVGIEKGMHTVLMVKPSTDFFVVLAAILKVGAIPVLVDPGMGMKNLKQCLEEAAPEAFIGIPRAHIGRKIFGWAKDTIRINVTAGKKYFWGGYTLDEFREKYSDEPYVMDQSSSDETAIIAVTSGNTGIPKGVVFTRSMITAQLDFLNNIAGWGDDEIDLSTFPHLHFSHLPRA